VDPTCFLTGLELFHVVFGSIVE